MLTGFAIRFASRFMATLVATLFFAPHLNYVPGTANTLTDMGATALRQAAWNQTLREDNVLDDVFNHLQTGMDVRVAQMEIPNAVFMQFPAPPQFVNRLTFAMSTPLKEAASMGNNTNILGTGEDIDLFHLTLRYNELKKAIKYRGWGIDYNDLSWTGIYGQINQKAKNFFMELRGRRIREALMLSYGEELTASPVSLKQQFNDNIWIPNLDLGDMPTWDITDLTKDDGSIDALNYYPSRTFSGLNTYVEAIGAAMVSAAGSGGTSLAYLDVENLAALEYYVEVTLHLRKIQIGSERGYIFLLPKSVAAYLVNPNVSGSMGAAWVQYAALSTKEQSIPGMLGRYGCLWFVIDSRSPTLTLSGSEGSYALTPGFVQPGDNDDRNRNPWSAASGSVNYPFDVGYVLGAGAVAEWVVSKLQNGMESTEFGKLLEKGFYEMGGIQLPRFEKDTPDDANNSGGTGAGKTAINRGSCMVLISRRPIAAIKA